MVAGFVSDLERLVSFSRLERYRPADRDDHETAINYLWNVALSESLLQSLAMVEVALRNSVHRALTAKTGSEYWFWAFLTGQELENFNKEWAKLANNQRQLPTSGKVIAHQSFGFWHRLFQQKYDQLWTVQQSALLWAVFPHHPRVGVPPAQWLTRGKIQTSVKLFVDLRNRAMHHEPIFQGLARPDETRPGHAVPTVPLLEIHRQIYDMLDWIDPQLRVALAFVDRFPSILESGRRDLGQSLMSTFMR